MFLNRLIPVLLLKGKRLVKTKIFRDPYYVGDPINAVKLFNDKEVDELIFLDIDASKFGNEPNYKYIAEIASECFMPFTYGGGIKTLAQAGEIFKAGAEKISLKTALWESPQLITEIAEKYGTQSVVVSLDIIKTKFSNKYYPFDHISRRVIRHSPISLAKKFESLGAGEVLITAVNNEGNMSGYDIELINQMSNALSIPVIANGGAGSLMHIQDVFRKTSASAAAAGSLFVFHRHRKAVLINYPDVSQIQNIFRGSN